MAVGVGVGSPNGATVTGATVTGATVTGAAVVGANVMTDGTADGTMGASVMGTTDGTSDAMFEGSALRTAVGATVGTMDVEGEAVGVKVGGNVSNVLSMADCVVAQTVKRKTLCSVVGTSPGTVPMMGIFALSPTQQSDGASGSRPQAHANVLKVALTIRGKSSKEVTPERKFGGPKSWFTLTYSSGLISPFPSASD
jgi:hypothetical protein